VGRSGKELRQFARHVLRNFRHWGALGIRESSGEAPGEWYEIAVTSPTGHEDAELSIRDDGRQVSVAWHGWHEQFDCTTFDNKDREFGQLINLLRAIDAEEAIVVDEFAGDKWIRSTIHAVKDDGQIGVAGSRVGALRLTFWKRATRASVHSWKGTLDNDVLL
jgi:hypothetical protein